MRYFLEIAFDGKIFHGWQIQPIEPTVQSEVDKALSKILRIPTYCLGCGRTDAGVHSSQFYLHFDSEEQIIDQNLFLRKFNGVTPPQIAANRLIEVNEKAHARYSALSRTYEYIITLKNNPFLIDRAYYIRIKPDLEKMNKACDMLIGKKDFKAFSRMNDLTNHICDLTYAKFEEEGDLIKFTITANRFLRNMVRAIMGTMLNIGYGKTQIDDFPEIIASGLRSKAGKSVPASGLYLSKITYPLEIIPNE